MPNQIRKQNSVRNGAAVVEFAILMPFVMLVFVGVTEICNTIYLEQTLKISAYEGARTAIVPGAVEYDVLTRAVEIAESRNVSGATATVSPTNFDSLPLGSYITVEVSAPRRLSNFFSKLLTTESVVTQRVTMMKEY